MHVKKLWNFFRQGLLLQVSLFIILVGVLQLGAISQFNTILLDNLQSTTEPRSDIVVVGIDEKSLKQLGAWPWNRDIFAHSIDVLQKHNPSVVGFDILFIENRNGDDSLQKSLTHSTVPIVFGSKIDNNSVINSKFKDVNHGYVNFTSDYDGKIRKSQLCDTFDSQETSSFALALYQGKSSNSKIDCNQYNNNFFHYSNTSFSYISFADVYNNTLPFDIKDKTLIVGLTLYDIKNDFNDTFIAPNGDRITGVEINANVLNSLYQRSFSRPINPAIFGIVMLFFVTILFWIYLKNTNEYINVAVFIVSLLANLIGGIFLYAQGYNWLFIHAFIILIACYFFVYIFKYTLSYRRASFIHRAFNHYVNPKFVNQLIKHPESFTLGGEMKYLTVLFSDIRNFTSFAEDMSPDDLAAFINDYLEEMCEIVINKYGTIDKFIGDAIMAFWNAPVDIVNHETKALEAAIKMNDVLANFSVQHNLPAPLKIGIGIHSGTVLVGNIGSRKRFNYTALGDAVNIASRLEGLTKKYGVSILVSDAAISKIALDDVVFRLIDSVAVKGKHGVISVYEPLKTSSHNLRIKKIYEQAFACYQNRDFEASKKLLHSIISDKPSQNLTARMETFVPEEDWQGEWRWMEK